MFPGETKSSHNDLCQLTMERLFSAGATPDEVIEIITKLYIADKIDHDGELIDSMVMGYFSEHVYSNPDPKQTIQARVEAWLFSHTSHKACYSDVTCSLLVCYSELGLKTPRDKASCRMAFKRLVEKFAAPEISGA